MMIACLLILCATLLVSIDTNHKVSKLSTDRKPENPDPVGEPIRVVDPHEILAAYKASPASRRAIRLTAIGRVMEEHDTSRKEAEIIVDGIINGAQQQ